VIFKYQPRTQHQLLGRISQRVDTDFITPAVNVTAPIAAPATLLPNASVTEATPADELVAAIKAARGVLKISASGRLQLGGERIPDELFAALQARQEEVTALLLSRKKVKADAVAPVAEPAEGFVETRRAYVCCATCGHWRSAHCTRRRLKPGQVLTHTVWKGLEIEGKPEPCSHTLPDAQPYACSSWACAQIIGSGTDEHFCECTKFVSPFLKKKVAKSQPHGGKYVSLIPESELVAAHARYMATLAVPKAKDHKAEILIEVVREDPSLTVAQLAVAAEHSPSWVRRHLRAAGLLAPATPRNKTTITGTLVTTGQQSQN
jgi:hypothetical protein